MFFGRNVVSKSGTSDNYKDLCYDKNDILQNETCDGKAPKDWVSVVIIFVGIFTVGIGSTGIFSFGIPYVDDNAQRSQSPMALSSIMAGRIVGPTLGYILGSFTLRVYVNPGANYEGKIRLDYFYASKWKITIIIRLNNR